MNEEELQELLRQAREELDEKAKADGLPTLAELIDEFYELFG